VKRRANWLPGLCGFFHRLLPAKSIEFKKSSLATTSNVVCAVSYMRSASRQTEIPLLVE
jgi:hypothetical protein